MKALYLIVYESREKRGFKIRWFNSIEEINKKWLLESIGYTCIVTNIVFLKYERQFWR